MSPQKEETYSADKGQWNNFGLYFFFDEVQLAQRSLHE